MGTSTAGNHVGLHGLLQDSLKVHLTKSNLYSCEVNQFHAED
jgi:hypothetical protein